MSYNLPGSFPTSQPAGGFYRSIKANLLFYFLFPLLLDMEWRRPCMLGKSLPMVTPQHGLPFLGERSGSGFCKGPGEEGLVREVWSRTYTSLTNQNCTNSMHSQGRKHFKPNGKQETELQVGQGAFHDRQTQLLKEHLISLVCGLKSTLYTAQEAQVQVT